LLLLPRGLRRVLAVLEDHGETLDDFRLALIVCATLSLKLLASGVNRKLGCAIHRIA
jgi:hypothetical protein